MTIKNSLPAILITGLMILVLSVSLINFNQSRNPQTKAANMDYGQRIRIINATGTQNLNTEFLVPIVLRNVIDAADLVINYDSTKMTVVVEPQSLSGLSLLTPSEQINLVNSVNSRIMLSFVTANNLAATNLGDGQIAVLLKITPKVVGNIFLVFSPQTTVAGNNGTNVTGFTIPSTGFIFGTYNIVASATPTSNIVATSTPTLIPTNIPTPGPAAYSKRINVGGSAYTDPQSNSWLADKVYSAGTYGYVGGGQYSTASVITGTLNQTVYKTERYNMSAYKVDVPNGSYNVTLKFAEIYSPSCAINKRGFNVDLQSVRVLTNFDIFVNAGGCNKAVDKTFTVNVTNGILTIGFSNVSGKDVSVLNGVEAVSVSGNATPTPTRSLATPTTAQATPTSYVTPTSVQATPTVPAAATSTPIPTSTPGSAYTKRVNVGGPAYTDSQSNSWLADKAYSAGTYGYVGGGQYSTVSVISGTSDQTLYKTERYNMSTYKIDVPNGNYKVTLKFAEIYSPSCAVGKRVFNVDIQGIRALTNFDIFIKAGKICNRAIDQTFTANVANGVLTIGFAWVSGDVQSINAIEVIQLP